MNTLLAMSVFRRVAETGHFSAVAREMGISQPSVSKHIAALETRLKTRLFNRSTRQLALTDAGTQYYERCASVLDELADIEDNLRHEQSRPTGTLRINTPVSFGQLHVVPLLWEFLNQYPDLKIDLLMDDHYVDLIKEGIDLAIRLGPLDDSNLIARKIGDTARVIVASPDYLTTHGRPKILSDLKNHNCIIYSLLTTGNVWHFTGPSGKEKIRVDGRFSANTPEAIREAVLAGFGIAVSPSWLISDCVEQGRLTKILQNYTPTPMEIHAIYPERRFVPAKVRFFIDHLIAGGQWNQSRQ